MTFGCAFSFLRPRRVAGGRGPDVNPTKQTKPRTRRQMALRSRAKQRATLQNLIMNEPNNRANQRQNPANQRQNSAHRRPNSAHRRQNSAHRRQNPAHRRQNPAHRPTATVDITNNTVRNGRDHSQRVNIDVQPPPSQVGGIGRPAQTPQPSPHHTPTTALAMWPFFENTHDGRIRKKNTERRRVTSSSS